MEDLVFTLFSDPLHICNLLEDCAKINLLEGFSSYDCSLVDILFQPMLMYIVFKQVLLLWLLMQ